MWHVPVGEDVGIFHAKSWILCLDPKLDFQVAPDKSWTKEILHKYQPNKQWWCIPGSLYWLIFFPNKIWVVWHPPETAKHHTCCPQPWHVAVPAASTGDRIAQRLELECLESTGTKTTERNGPTFERARSSEKKWDFFIVLEWFTCW